MASDLEIRIGAELSEIKGALASLQKDLTKVDRQAKDTGKDALGGLQNGISGAVTAVQGLVAAFAALQVGSKFIELADQAQNFQARLRLVTNSTAEFQQALTGVQKIATATRQPLADVADLYTRLAQNLTDSPERLLDLTQTISKAVTLSGSSAQAAQAAIVQLGQGLAAGQLRGQELNSVLEQTPRLARAIEEGLGLARGGLRAFAEEGKVSAEAIKQALASQAETIDKEFSQLPTTIGQSFTLLNNAALQFVGVLDQANGLSAGFATTVKALADNFNLLAGAITAVVAIPLAAAIGRAVAAIAGAVVAMRAMAVSAGAAAAATTLLSGALRLLGGPIGAVLTLLGLAASAYTAFGTKTESANAKAVDSTKRTTADIIASIDKQIEKINERNKILQQGPIVEASPTANAEKDLSGQQKRYLDAINAARNAATEQDRARLNIIAQEEGRRFQQLYTAVQRLNQAQNENLRITQKQKATEYLKEYANDAEKLAEALAKAKKELGAQFTPDIERRIRERFAKGGNDAAKAGLDAQEKLLKDSTQRQIAILQEQFDQGTLSAADYYDQRTQIELAALDRSIEIERRRVKQGGTDGIKAKAELQILENQKTDVIRKAAAEREKAIAELSIDRAQADKRIQEATGQTALSNIERLNERGLIAINDFYSQREQIELASLEKSLEIERLRAQAGGKERTAALAEITALEEQRKQIIERNAAERAAAERKLNDDITAAKIQQLELEGKTAQAEQLKLETQYRDFLQRLQTEGNEAGIQLVKNLINASAAKAQFDELKTQFDRVLETLQQRQIALNAQRDTGAISGDTASQQISTERTAAIAQLTELNKQLQDLAVNTNNPAIISGALATGNALRQLGIDSATGLEKAAISLRSSLEQMKQSFAENALQAGADALSGLFNDLASGSKSAGDAVRDFARNVALSIAQLAAKILATWATLQFINLLPGGPAVLKAMDLTAGVKHGGGMAGTGPLRRVNPLLFAGAPRYHSGGMVGLKPGEVPAILQTGEEVLSRRDPRNAANGGSGTNVRIINSIDPEIGRAHV